jgi:hypothetical protein
MILKKTSSQPKLTRQTYGINDGIMIKEYKGNWNKSWISISKNFNLEGWNWKKNLIFNQFNVEGWSKKKSI